MQTFAISPGWKLNPPILIQMRLPRTSWPMPGSMGMSRSTMPSTMKVYL